MRPGANSKSALPLLPPLLTPPFRARATKQGLDSISSCSKDCSGGTVCLKRPAVCCKMRGLPRLLLLSGWHAKSVTQGSGLGWLQPAADHIYARFAKIIPSTQSLN